MTDRQTLSPIRPGLLDKLPNMAIFAHVVATNSFTQTAQELNLSRSKVSKSITTLEASLGVRLLYRTTRCLTLTDEGRAFNERCTRMLAEAEAAEQTAAHLQDKPHGTLTLSVPPYLGIIKLNQILPSFMKRYPELIVDIEFNESFVDVIKEGCDLAIRVAHELHTSSLVARRIAESKLNIVASPSYCREHECPETLQDLAQHNCIIYRGTSASKRWTAIGLDGKKEYVEIKGTLNTNRSDFELQAALDGIGIARLPDFVCGPDLAAGRLIRLLENVTLPPLGIYTVYPQRQYLPAKVRVFIDFLVSSLNDAQARCPASFIHPQS